MTRLIESVYISNAKLEEDPGEIKINTQWGSSWSQVGFQIGTLFLGLIKASSPRPFGLLTNFSFKTSQIPFISKEKKQTDLHSAVDCPRNSAV